MMPAMKHEPTAGALRASRAIQRDASLLKSLPELMDRETGVREVLEILEKEFRTCEYNEFHVSRFSPSQIDPIRSGTSSRPLRQLPEMVLGNIALKSWSWEAAHLLRVTERQMPNYRVIWRIDVEAESAVAAAERAREVQRDPESIASLFEVIERPSPRRQTDHSTPRIAVDVREVVVGD